MDLSLFDYSFPKELTAQHPLPRREDSRMMVVHRQKGRWEHRKFTDILDYLKTDDLLIMNNAEADLVEVGGRLVPPLPPYIKRKKAEDFTDEDYRRYRNVYASVPGSKAAPTAGFHFSEDVLEKIRQKSVDTRFVTLHVGYDTYKPIQSQNISEHPMHGEMFEVPVETAAAVKKAKAETKRVIAVGTTVIRSLESWAVTPDEQGRDESRPYEGMTDLFITPGFSFQIVDALLTNFHRPRSTVLVMVSAFSGRDLIMAAYQEAIREKYRLFSYGDCMLIV